MAQWSELQEALETHKAKWYAEQLLASRREMASVSGIPKSVLDGWRQRDRRREMEGSWCGGTRINGPVCTGADGIPRDPRGRGVTEIQEAMGEVGRAPDDKQIYRYRYQVNGTWFYPNAASRAYYEDHGDEWMGASGNTADMDKQYGTTSDNTANASWWREPVRYLGMEKQADGSDRVFIGGENCGFPVGGVCVGPNPFEVEDEPMEKRVNENFVREMIADLGLNKDQVKEFSEITSHVDWQVRLLALYLAEQIKAGRMTAELLGYEADED